jgi:hypothetical protein
MLALLVISLLFLFYVATYVRAWSKLRAFPGPFLASFSFL